MAKTLRIAQLNVGHTIAALATVEGAQESLAGAGDIVSYALSGGLLEYRKPTARSETARKAVVLAQETLDAKRESKNKAFHALLAGADDAETVESMLAMQAEHVALMCRAETEAVADAESELAEAYTENLEKAANEARRRMQASKQPSVNGLPGIANQVIRYGRKDVVCWTRFSPSGVVEWIRWADGRIENTQPCGDAQFSSKSQFGHVLSHFLGNDDTEGVSWKDARAVVSETKSALYYIPAEAKAGDFDPLTGLDEYQSEGM